jgi:hypothetical protein
MASTHPLRSTRIPTKSIHRATSAAAGSPTPGRWRRPHPLPHTPVVGSGPVAAQAAPIEGWRACGGEGPPRGMETSAAPLFSSDGQVETWRCHRLAWLLRARHRWPTFWSPSHPPAHYPRGSSSTATSPPSPPPTRCSPTTSSRALPKGQQLGAHAVARAVVQWLVNFGPAGHHELHHVQGCLPWPSRRFSTRFSWSSNQSPFFLVDPFSLHDGATQRSWSSTSLPNHPSVCSDHSRLRLSRHHAPPLTPHCRSSSWSPSRSPPAPFRR